MVCMRLGEGQCICTGENCIICGFLVYNTPMGHHNQYMLLCLGSPSARETPEHHAVRGFSTLRARRNRAPQENKDKVDQSVLTGPITTSVALGHHWE